MKVYLVKYVWGCIYEGTETMTLGIFKTKEGAEQKQKEEEESEEYKRRKRTMDTNRVEIIEYTVQE